MSGERRRMRWWVPLVAIPLLVAAANGAGLAFLQHDRAVRREPSLTVLRPPGEVSCLLLDGGTLYAGGLEGVWAVDMRTLKVTRPAFASKADFGHVRGLARSGGALWIGHERGLTRVAGAEVRTYTKADGLPASRVQCLLVQRTAAGERLWIGTEGGAAHLDGSAITPFTMKDGLAEDMVNAMALDPAGGLWFGSYVAPRGGLTRFGADGKRTVITKDSGLPHADVTCVTPMRDGEVWVGTGFDTRGGLAVFDTSGAAPRLVRTLTKADGLPGEKVRSIARLSDGTLLIGSERDGLLVRTPAGDRILTTADGMADDEVKVAVQSADGRVWLGTRNGIVVMRGVAALVRR